MSKDEAGRFGRATPRGAQQANSPGASPDEKLRQALAHHRRGDLARAETLYRDLLAADSDRVDALHLLGVLSVQTKRLARGIELLDKAAALKPDFAEAHFHGACALQDIGRLDEALARFDKTIALRPQFAEAFNHRGAVLRGLRRLDEALQSFDAAIAIKPDFVDALNNKGVVLTALRRYEEALACLDAAIAIAPNFAGTHGNRGVALAKLQRIGEASASFDKALAIDPNQPGALNNRGLALKALRRTGEALADFDRAIALAPNFAAAHNNRANALREMKRFEEAIQSFDRALRIENRSAEVHNNRGAALAALGRPAEALENYDAALALDPGFAQAHDNRGAALRELSRFAEAIASFDEALRLDPQFVEARVDKALCLLLLGDFPTGWALNEHRRKKARYAGHFASRAFARPQWDGSQPLAGKRLFVFWEQGLGDTIQFARFALLAQRSGAKVVFSAQNPLRKLLTSLGPGIEFIDESAAPAEFDYYCSLLSLPRGFQTTLDSIPAHAPYLSVDPARIRDWRSRLGAQGFKIGVAWQGNSASPADLGRSFRLEEYRGLSLIPNVRLISLQKNEGAEQLRDAMRIEVPDDRASASDEAFLETAAIMENLDLVVTSDTSVAHLAGALGRPVWTALRHVPDWRWLLDRNDSPWYPSMRLFRQSSPGDWRSVFREIESAARALAAGEPPASGAATRGGRGED